MDSHCLVVMSWLMVFLFVSLSSPVVNRRLEDDHSTIKYLSEVDQGDTPVPSGAAFSRKVHLRHISLSCYPLQRLSSMSRSPPIRGLQLEYVPYLAVNQPFAAFILLKRKPPAQRICRTFLLISPGGTSNPSDRRTEVHRQQYGSVFGVCMQVNFD